MKKCVFDNGDLLDVIDAGADRSGVREISARLRTVQAKLLPTLTGQQRVLFRQFDDLVVEEGTARVNGALMVACGCKRCAENKPAEIRALRRILPTAKAARSKQQRA